jgi:predicted metalloprotease with PDZ domain
MSSPKHLWSGDWQRDSEAAARERAERLRDQPQAEPAPAPAQPHAKPTAATATAPPRARPRPRWRPALAKLRAGLALDRAQRRLVATVAAVALLVAGSAYGLSALIGGSNDSTGPTLANSGGWLGLQMQGLANGTVVVASVVPGSPAAGAGLQPGDAITQIEGRPVGAPIVVTEAVAALQPGDTVEIQFVRGSAIYTVRPKLTARPASVP